jgi:NYN domain
VMVEDQAEDLPVHILVDFQNVIPDGASPRSQLEVQWLLAGVVDAVSTSIRSAYPLCRETRVHLYGGWSDHDARVTRHAQWLQAEVARGRTRRHGIRVLPRLVTSLQCAPSVVLIGTSRPRNSLGKQQKMVDCMMALDAVHIANNCRDPLVIWTDDDDLVPAVVSVAAVRGVCYLWRRRPAGSGINDQLLRRTGASISKVEVLGDF